LVRLYTWQIILIKNLATSDKRKIIATRHFVVHDYDIIDAARILIIVQRDLPVLKNEVKEILPGI
jgi:uncharacterized protein with HEPN domain